MRLKTQKRMTRKAAVAAALLGATLVLPGTAVADHDPNNIRNPYTCDPSVPDDCPNFEASAFFRVQNPVKNQSSAVNFEFSQPDRRMPVMLANYFLPKGWRFGGLSTLRPSAHAGSPTSCHDAHNSNGSLNQTELLSAGTGMLLQREARRADDPSDEDEAINAAADPTLGPATASPAIDYGYKPRDVAIGTRPDLGQRQRFPSVSFIDWDGTTARFCYYHRHNNAATRGDNEPPPPGGFPPSSPNPNAIPIEFIGEGTLTRLAGDPNYDWRVSFEMDHVFSHPNVRAQQGSVWRHNLELGSMTAGNWNRHPVTGELNKVQFSRTPLEPGNYPFRAELFTCESGLAPGHPTGCVGGAYTSPIVVEQVIPITPAPDVFSYDWGKLNGPATPGLCANTVCPLGLVRGTNSFDVDWTQPALVDGQEVRGYALTIAKPGDQASRKFYRLITDPSEPGFDPSVCGPAGGDPLCTFKVNLPVQSTDGSTTLTPDGKYHLALVTIYSDGRRTDLKCDELTGAGMACPPSTPRMKVINDIGISTWQVLIRSDVWPRAFVNTFDDDSNTTHDSITNYTLLLDCNLKEAELIVWNTNDKVSSFRAFSNLILCSNEPFTPGLVEFNNGTSAGATRNWVVAVELDPPIPGSGATGTFLSYNIKNPGLNPPTVAGWPEIGQPGCGTIDPTGLTTIFADTKPCIWFFAVEI